MVTPEAIREVFDQKYDDLMAGGSIDEASLFASETKKLVMASLPELAFLASAALVRLLEYLDDAILKADIAKYNLEWNVDLRTEPEQKEAPDG